VRFQFYGRWLACSHLLFYVSAIIVNLGYAPYNVCIFFFQYIRQLTKKKKYPKGASKLERKTLQKIAMDYYLDGEVFYRRSFNGNSFEVSK